MSSESILQSRIGRRIICLESPENLIIKISTPKRIIFLVVLFVWLGGWGILGGYVTFFLWKTGVDLSFAFCWFSASFFALYAWLWGAVGKEIISINNNKISITQSIFGLGLRQTYQLVQVSNLRKSLTNPSLFTLEQNLQEWGFAGGSVAFDYKGNLCRFGLLLSEKDADLLVTRINQYLRILST